MEDLKLDDELAAAGGGGPGASRTGFGSLPVPRLMLARETGFVRRHPGALVFRTGIRVRPASLSVDPSAPVRPRHSTGPCEELAPPGFGCGAPGSGGSLSAALASAAAALPPPRTGGTWKRIKLRLEPELEEDDEEERDELGRRLWSDRRLRLGEDVLPSCGADEVGSVNLA